MLIVLHTACGAQLNGVGIISYYLVPVLKSIGIASYLQQCLINGGLSISNFVWATIASMLTERVGRRPLWLFSTSVMLVSLVIITALSATFVSTGTDAVGRSVIAFLYLFYAGYDFAWSPLNSAYTVEILTYNMRAKGLAVWTFATYASLSFNTWVNPIALEHIAWKYYIVYIGVLCYLLVIIFFLYPETCGRTLEEVAHVFDRINNPVDKPLDTPVDIGLPPSKE
jgi:MFS family permease